MRVVQAFRFELDPNAAQRIALAKHVGAARFAYNWGLARCMEALKKEERIPSAVELHKAWNRWKRENAPWWVEVSKCAPQEAFRDLERAFRNWREGRSGFPRLKRKKALDDNKARLTGSIRVTPRHVQLPRIGRVRVQERTDRLLNLLRAKKARVLSATISREADRWFVSLTCEVEIPDPDPLPPDAPVVGVDMDLEDFAVLADGEKIERIGFGEVRDKIRKLDKRLRREQRRLSRRQKALHPDPKDPQRKHPSRRYLKQLVKVQRLHRRIRNLRTDFLHKVSTWLAKAKRVYGVEDLNLRGMMRRRRQGPHLSRSLAEQAWGTFLRMLKYKSERYGSKVIVADRFFPSSKTCSACGAVNRSLRRSDRVFWCPECSLAMDRDENAALNLRNYGLAVLNGPTGSSPGSDARGDRRCGGTGARPGLRASGRRSGK